MIMARIKSDVFSFECSFGHMYLIGWAHSERRHFTHFKLMLMWQALINVRPIALDCLWNSVCQMLSMLSMCSLKHCYSHSASITIPIMLQHIRSTWSRSWFGWIMFRSNWLCMLCTIIVFGFAWSLNRLEMHSAIGRQLWMLVMCCL